MTDATRSVTWSAVKQFAEQYFAHLDTAIETADDRWHVTIPEDTDSDLDSGDYTLVLAADPGTVEPDETRLAPGSQFFQRLIDDARTDQRAGLARAEYEEADPLIPDWVTAGNAQIAAYRFTPYYDRRAVVALFHVGIETVSEYQTERLHAVAVDVRSGTPLPALETNVLDGNLVAEEGQREPTDPEAVTDTVARAREIVTDRIRPEAEEIREKAARRAAVEIEEFRQLKDQRIQELENEVERLTERIEERSEEAQTASSRDDRTDALRDRKQLRSELDEQEAKLTELRTAKASGFPEKRREIRDRHDVMVRISPVSLTLVRYEKGEMDMTLRSDRNESTLRIPFGGGVGLTESQTCDRCDREFSASNPLFVDQNQLVCDSCTGGQGDCPGA